MVQSLAIWLYIAVHSKTTGKKVFLVGKTVTMIGRYVGVKKTRDSRLLLNLLKLSLFLSDPANQLERVYND